MGTIQEAELYAVKNGTFDQGIAYLQAKQKFEEKKKINLTNTQLSKKSIRICKKKNILTIGDLCNTSQNERKFIFFWYNNIQKELNEFLNKL